MTLAERLSEYVRACFSGIWVQSFEHDDAIAEIARLCRQQGWSLATWDVDRGLAVAGPDDGASTAAPPPTRWPRSRRSAALATPEGTAILVLRNFHRFLGSVEIVAGARHGHHRRQAGPQVRRRPVPGRADPPELEQLSWSSSTTCPAATSSEQIARSIATEPGELPEGEELSAVLDAAAGLTRVEAENAFSLSLVRHGRVASDVLWEFKAQTLKKSGLMRSTAAARRSPTWLAWRP